MLFKKANQRAVEAEASEKGLAAEVVFIKSFVRLHGHLFGNKVRYFKKSDPL